MTLSAEATHAVSVGWFQPQAMLWLEFVPASAKTASGRVVRTHHHFETKSTTRPVEKRPHEEMIFVETIVETKFGEWSFEERILEETRFGEMALEEMVLEQKAAGVREVATRVEGCTSGAVR